MPPRPRPLPRPPGKLPPSSRRARGFCRGRHLPCRPRPLSGGVNGFHMAKLENPVLMGAVGRPQGIRGEVRVRSYTQDPMAIADYHRLFTADGRDLEILDVRPARNAVVVRFLGINDRDAAEALNGLELFVDRSSLPDDDLDEDEFFYADLEGLEVVDAEGRVYGTVSGVFDFGGGDLLELKGPGLRPTLIPFSEAAVREIDVPAGIIIVDPVAAGLVDRAGTGPGSRRRRPDQGRRGDRS